MVFVDFSRIQPLPFIFCSMLIRNGLKMSSRSLQERSKMPQDVQRPPTWGQHGPNMGPTWDQYGVQESSKIGPRGVKLLSRGGHQLRLLSDRSHGPHMDPKCTPNEPQVGVMLGSSWGRLGVILGSSWGPLAKATDHANGHDFGHGRRNGQWPWPWSLPVAMVMAMAAGHDHGQWPHQWP